MLAKPVGLGFGLLGVSNVAPISDAEAERMFAAALDLGIRRFDTAPLYGGGVSEERLGRLLGGLERSSYRLSTKVGRYRPYAAAVTNPMDNPGDWHDYSADATRRSIEQSLARLGTDRLDIVFIHDCDAHIGEALDGALPALADLKSQGVIGAIGCGSNIAATHVDLLRRFELDVLMVAGRFTLLDQSAAPELLPLATAKGVEVELAAPFNSGILATGTSDPRSRFDYLTPDETMLNRVRQIERICSAHDTTLKRAALGYPAAHPAVGRLILGLIGSAGLKSNLEDLQTPPPKELWDDLAGIGIPHPIGSLPED
ncbi:aldo/keto reductase [Halovulum sp. GXIMD14794]